MTRAKHSHYLDSGSHGASAIRLIRTHEWRAIARRFLQESDELRRALERGDEALILDELVDVAYFLRHMSSGRIDDVIEAYGAIKSNLRKSGIRNKEHELRVARNVLEADHAA